MTLSQFAYLLDVDPKWVQNLAATTGITLRYTLDEARRIALVREIVNALGLPTPRAFDMAGGLLTRYDGSRQPVALIDETGLVTAHVDVFRVLAAVHAGRARLRTMYAPRQRGRSRSPKVDPLERAAKHGLDLSLLRANLERTPAERLRQLDAMADFRRRVRRV